MNSMAFVHTLSDKASNFYNGRRAVLVSEQSESDSIAGLLEVEVGLHILSISKKDIESLEPTSKNLPVQYRSREKSKRLAKQAMAQTNASIGIASFFYKGRDTVAPFLNIYSQSLIFLDIELNLELFERSLTNQADMLSGNRNMQSKKPIHNLIRRLTVRLKQNCPECSMPGWGITFEKQGLECSACGLATREVQSHVWSCSACRYSAEIERYDGLKFANPEQCYACNH